MTSITTTHVVISFSFGLHISLITHIMQNISTFSFIFTSSNITICFSNFNLILHFKFQLLTRGKKGVKNVLRCWELLYWRWTKIQVGKSLRMHLSTLEFETVKRSRPQDEVLIAIENWRKRSERERANERLQRAAPRNGTKRNSRRYYKISAFTISALCLVAVIRVQRSAAMHDSSNLHAKSQTKCD